MTDQPTTYVDHPHAEPLRQAAAAAEVITLPKLVDVNDQIRFMEEAVGQFRLRLSVRYIKLLPGE